MLLTLFQNNLSSGSVPAFRPLLILTGTISSRPVLNAIIDGFVAGDDLQIARTYIGVPSGESIAKAWFTVKTREKDADGIALFQKVATAAANPGQGQITDAGATGTAQLHFDLTEADTVKLVGDRAYYFDLQIRTAAGYVYTPLKGRLVAKAQVTETAN